MTDWVSYHQAHMSRTTRLPATTVQPSARPTLAAADALLRAHLPQRRLNSRSAGKLPTLCAPTASRYSNPLYATQTNRKSANINNSKILYVISLIASLSSSWAWAIIYLIFITNALLFNLDFIVMLNNYEKRTQIIRYSKNTKYE